MSGNALFFASVRRDFGPLLQTQVDGINALLAAAAALPLEHRAYVLGTAWHETAYTMEPITEIGGHAYFNKYEPPSRLATALGNTLAGDGFKFRGRGYVQITGRRNYGKGAAVCGYDLLAQPDLALRPDVAATLIIHGMRDGWFTGRKMADYSDYANMRQVVNGHDHAGTIALYAAKFERALRAAGEAAAPASPAPPPPDIQPVDVPPITFWDRLRRLFSASP